MIEKILVFTYQKLPLGFRKFIGSRKGLKHFRNKVLRPDSKYRETSVKIDRDYLNFRTRFTFYASVSVAAKAQQKGVETTLLKHSIRLVKDKNVNNDLVVFDVGANFGYLSLVWAHSISQNGKIHAFEPNAQVAASFRKSINDNNLNDIIDLNNVVVGQSNGSVTLYASSTSSNTIELSDEEVTTTAVKMISLDYYMKDRKIDKCDVVKIDVDGIEYEILKGAEELINRFKPIFIVEINGDKRLVEFFEKRNYRILDMSLKVYKESDSLPANILCVYEG